MGASALEQFTELMICLAIGLGFALKITINEIIGGCSGKILRGVLDLWLGASLLLYPAAAMFFAAGGRLHFYHYLGTAAGIFIALPLLRRVLRPYRTKIERVWLFIIGKAHNDSESLRLEKESALNEEKLQAKKESIKKAQEKRKEENEYKRLVREKKKDAGKPGERKARNAILDNSIDGDSRKKEKRRPAFRKKDKKHRKNSSVLYHE